MAGHQIDVTKATPRLPALDIVRGAVMVLMAIDHVRVYSGVPAGGPTAGHLLHTLGDTLLRAGVCLSRRNRRRSSTG